MFSSVCIATVLLIQLLYLEANSVKNDTILRFWEPDPRFDHRRANDRSKDQRTSETRGIRQKSLRQEPNATPHFRGKSELETTRKRHGKPRFQTQALKDTDSSSLKQRRQGHKDVLRSTRIVKPENQINKKTTKANDDDRFRLSPYSIAQQLDEITSAFPEANVSTEILGRTAEYNNIVLLKITEKKSDINKYFRADDSKYIDETPEKKIVFIVQALSVMGADMMDCFMYSHHYSKLLSYYFAHLDKFDIFLIPMANPDGYAYVMGRQGSSLWNKNMSPQTECAGVALDRNFDVAWNKSQSISSCNQKYPGPSPFSEPETMAIRDVLHRYSLKIVAYMHLHAGGYNAGAFKGDAVLYPKGYTDTQSDDDKYIDLRGELDEAMKNASFKSLSVAVETLYNWYGQVFGTSVDYASTVYGVPYAMELVMQVYQEDWSGSGASEEIFQQIALEEVWARVIDVVFKSIWKNMHTNDV